MALSGWLTVSLWSLGMLTVAGCANRAATPLQPSPGADRDGQAQNVPPPDADRTRSGPPSPKPSSGGGTKLQFAGPYPDLSAMCADYTVRAMRGFDPELLATWKREGTERYATKKKPFVPSPSCSPAKTVNELGPFATVFVETDTGDPFSGFSTRLLAIRSGGAWYLADHRQEVPWFRYEEQGSHRMRGSKWTAAVADPTVSWTIDVHDSFVGHPSGECSSGANGQSRQISLRCMESLDGPDCTFEVRDHKTYDSPPACP